MPSAIALILCIGLVIFLLRLTVDKEDRISKAVWVPTIWLLISASRPVERWIHLGNALVEERLVKGSPLDQFLLSSLILIAVAILANRKVRWTVVLSQNRWILILLLYLVMSIAWSDYSLISLKRWIRAAGVVICAAVPMTEKRPQFAFETIIRRTIYVLIPFSVVLIKYFPAYGVEYGRWGGGRMAIGVAMQKNGLGLLCVICALFVGWDLLRKRRQVLSSAEKRIAAADLLILLITLYLLKGADTSSYSATSIGVLLLGVCVLLIFSRLRPSPERLNAVATVIGVATAALVLGASMLFNWSPMAALTALLGRNETLTGRVDIWGEVFKIAPRWSLFGAGFGGFWGLPYTFGPIGELTGHNGYLDAYVELGFFGVSILGIFLLSLWRKFSLLAKSNFDLGVLGVCFLLVSLAYNYTETDYLSVSSPLWTTLVFLSFVVSASLKECIHPVNETQISPWAVAESPDLSRAAENQLPRTQGKRWLRKEPE